MERKAIDEKIEANEAKAVALEIEIEEAKREEEKEEQQAKRARSSQDVYQGYAPYAHKEDVNKNNKKMLTEMLRTYLPNLDVHDASAFTLDGPDVGTTKTLNAMGITSVDIVNDNRHGDYDSIQQHIVDCKIQANPFKGSVCDFLGSNRESRYHFIFHDGHGWSHRAKEISALFDHIADVCLLAVSVQVKGCGVHSQHGLVQKVTVKEERQDDDESNAPENIRVTDIKKHTEIHQFLDIVSTKAQQMNVEIRKTFTDFEAPRRHPSTMFKVLMWILDARNMSQQPLAHDDIVP